MQPEQNIAAIDIGTNSFHLIVVKTDKHGGFEIIDREKEVIRLNEGSTGDIKEIKPEAIERALVALSSFAEIAKSHNAIIRATATSAVREANNRQKFIETVSEHTGIDIEVISGHEEARLIYLGILKAIPVYNNRILCFDIGGGSTEFTVGSRGIIQYSNSLKLGAVRLSNMFFPDYKLGKSKIKNCRNWVRGDLFHTLKSISKHKYSRVIASSGTALATASIIHTKEKGALSDLKMLNNYTFTCNQLFEVEEEILSCKTTEERLKIAGLESKRADIIPAGIILLSEIVRGLGVDKITISDYALREGIIIDTLRKSDKTTRDSELFEVRKSSVKQLAKSCTYPREHCYHVRELALKMFEELADLHGLPDETAEYLEAAAILHDIGHHIAHSQHHKHTQYIILNSEMMGFNDRELLIISNIARYHRKSHPKKRHEHYMALSKPDRELVSRLAAILRVTDSLDRTHSGNITNIKSYHNTDKVLLQLSTQNGYPELELWNLERRKGLFEEIFSKKIEISIIPEEK